MPWDWAEVTLTIIGEPRTKKNSQRIMQTRGRRWITQSAAYCSWETTAVLQLQAQFARRSAGWPGGHAAIDVPVTMRALVYRDRDVGDLLNYLAAVSDALEAAGVVLDDKLVASVDGSRLLLDRVRPRVEVTIEAMPA